MRFQNDFILMWLVLAFVSATFLGFYDTSKKASLKDNAVLPVLLLNTIFSTVIFSPFLVDYLGGFGWFAEIDWLNPSTVYIDSQALTQNACCTDTAGILRIRLYHSDLDDYGFTISHRQIDGAGKKVGEIGRHQNMHCRAAICGRACINLRRGRIR